MYYFSSVAVLGAGTAPKFRTERYKTLLAVTYVPVVVRTEEG
jgi:hypothetical protein